MLLGFLRSYEARLSGHTKIKGVATANAVQSGSHSPVVCQICDKKVHSALACYYRHNEQRFASKNDKARSRFHSNRDASMPVANAIWYPDSRASDHITGKPQYIQSSDATPSSKTLTVANGNLLQIDLIGSSKYSLGHKSVNLNNIIHAPAVTKNLLSVSKFCNDNSVSLRFDARNVYLKDNHSGNNDEVVIGNIKEGLYQIELNDCPTTSETNTCSSVDQQTWHSRFGHTCEQMTRRLIN